MTEKELKFIVPDEPAYQRLLALLGEPQARMQQVNRYFDTPDGRVTAGFAALRERTESGRRVLTFKAGKRQQDGYFEALEFECELDDQLFPDQCWGLAPMVEFTSRFGEGPLVEQGATENLRLCFRLSGGWLLELDRTVFPGGRVEFEAEVETEDPEATRAELATLFAQAQVALTPQTKTKYARFLEAVQRRP
ncbi:MAG: CYTH domain-containing protein [Vulcanimicrobiota bacterium]